MSCYVKIILMVAMARPIIILNSTFYLIVVVNLSCVIPWRTCVLYSVSAFFYMPNVGSFEVQSIDYRLQYIEALGHPLNKSLRVFMD